MGKHVHRWKITGRISNKVYEETEFCCQICGKFKVEPKVRKFEECEGITYMEYQEALCKAGLEEPVDDTKSNNRSDREHSYIGRF